MALHKNELISSMPKLGVNIDHVATIREARKIDYPDPVSAAVLCLSAGADSVVCHLREDRRHIQDKDLYRLKKVLSGKLNLEMAPSDEIADIAGRVNPEQATLVPERRMELTTEGGLDVVSGKSRIKKIADKLKTAGIEVSLFVEPNIKQIKACGEVGCGMIELHTGCYANAKAGKALEKEYLRIKKSAEFANSIGLRVFAGHGLNYENIKLLRGIKEIEEYNIGHSIVARAIFVGIENAVREMKALLSQ